jgi:addiction module HigA family antidote
LQHIDGDMTGKNEYKPIKAFHPGITLRDKLSEMEMSIKEFAVRTEKPEKTINAVLTGASSVTPDMAIAFEQVTRIPAHFWLNLQRSFDEYLARKKREECFQDPHNQEWASRFPYAKMASKGWVPATRSSSEKVKNLLDYFGITSTKAWEDYFLRQELKVSFRISLANAKDPYAVSAWLRRGELLASEQAVEQPYCSVDLKQAIPVFLKLVEEQPDDFADRLVRACTEVGVKLVFVPHIQHAPVNGCVRWIGDTPCIQLTDRQKRNDVFWFSFFHEIGHILLHGKKDIFLEDDYFRANERNKEDEADQFASRTLLPVQAECDIVNAGDFTPSAIMKYAEKYHTHPAIIVGRLQFRGLIPFDSPLNKLVDHLSVNEAMNDN